MNEMHDKFMSEAVSQALESVKNNIGGPFGAIVVKNGHIIGRGTNSVLSLNDPTAHAEVMAIRDACKNLNSYQLNDCFIYTTCEPCPMCLGAIYWARPKAVYMACSKLDAAEAGFDDAFIYDELPRHPEQRKIPFINLNKENAMELFHYWKVKTDKTLY
jgi:tRNA(Arg) A34 adenosine deaminase TadA